jgi:LPXTG-motif cell wall-anchored protein
MKLGKILKVSLLSVILFVSAASMAFALEEKNGQIVIEAEDYTSIFTVDTHKWEKVPAISGEAMYLSPDENINWTDESDALKGTAPELTYEIKFNTPGTYTVWALINAPHQGSDSTHLGFNDKYIASNKAIKFHEKEYYWNNLGTINVPSAGTHKVNLWPREDGMYFDQLFLTTAQLADDDVPAKVKEALAAQSASSAPAQNNNAVANPKTGTDGIALYVVMAVLAGAAVIYFARRKTA